MIALVDLISTDLKSATVYLTFEREDYRKAWIAKRLKELGHVTDM
jgi:ribosome-binding factor A